MQVALYPPSLVVTGLDKPCPACPELAQSRSQIQPTRTSSTSVADAAATWLSSSRESLRAGLQYSDGRAPVTTGATDDR
jgi:hypothetical protein